MTGEIGDRKLRPQNVDLLTYCKNYNDLRDQYHLFWHDWHILILLSDFMVNQVIIEHHIMICHGKYSHRPGNA